MRTANLTILLQILFLSLCGSSAPAELSCFQLFSSSRAGKIFKQVSSLSAEQVNAGKRLYPKSIAKLAEIGADYQVTQTGRGHYQLQILGGPSRLGRIARSLKSNYDVNLKIDVDVEPGTGHVTKNGDLVLSYRALWDFESQLPVLAHEAAHAKIRSNAKLDIDEPLDIVFRSSRGLPMTNYRSYMAAEEAQAFYKGKKVSRSLLRRTPLISLRRIRYLDQFWSDALQARGARKAAERILTEVKHQLEDGTANITVYPWHFVEIHLEGFGRFGRDINVEFPFVFEGRNGEKILKENHDLVIGLLTDRVDSALAQLDFLKSRQ